MSIAVITLTRHEVAAQLELLERVYLDMYSLSAEAGPPFADGLLERSQREGFKLCAAYDDQRGELVGLAYGFTGLPGQMWTDAMAEALEPTVAEEWLDRHFEFAEFGVMQARQGAGIGARLHDALFADLPQRRAVLTVRTRQQPARGFYERRGWITLHQDFYSTTGRGPYCIMGLDLAR